MSSSEPCQAYKLRCVLVGHEKDVRTLCPAVYPEEAIISGSRDLTARVWVPNEFDSGFTEAHIMSGHSNFISCACTLPPSEAYPTGLIFTGSNDNNIFAYTLDSPKPLFKLSEHSDTVCALAAGKFGTLLSGSWDTTAKVWLNQKCVMTLKGHEAAVWAVGLLPEQGLMLTGSADKTIKMWRTGTCERTFKGHEDCVRGIAVLNAAEFLSCSNDSTVKRWMITGECSQTYYSHTNYVYSLAVLPNGQDFVSCGEDRTVRVWQHGKCTQTITHPTQSVWAVCCLQNGDIVSGSSDGMIRVFTKDPSKMASEEVEKTFEEEVASSTIPTQTGDLKIDELPGPEVLFNPGKRDGQTMMVRDGDTVTAHQWDAAKSSWRKVGNVVGSSGSTQSTSGKQLYKGKEYDYVFDVELEEGKPPLKLPYNVAEDHWMAAHKFLEENDLSPLFLDQVANFIRDQCKSVTLGSATPKEYSDPFTGGGRYIPGSGSAAPQQSEPASMSDPFTGGGRYVPSSTQHSTLPSQPVTQHSGADSSVQAEAFPTSSFFPSKNILSFDSFNASAILGKLKEFNRSGQSAVVDNESVLDGLGSVLDGTTVSPAQLDLLWNLLQWPQGVIFPVLDVWRLAVKSRAVDQHFFNDKDADSCLNRILSFVTPENPLANQMLVLRILSNMFILSWGERSLKRKRDTIISAALSTNYQANKNIQIAIATLLLNYAVVYSKQQDIEAKSLCISAVARVMAHGLDAEASFRSLVCLGTIIHQDEEAVTLARSLNLTDVLEKFQVNSYPQKVIECASHIHRLLQ